MINPATSKMEIWTPGRINTERRRRGALFRRGRRRYSLYLSLYLLYMLPLY